MGWIKAQLPADLHKWLRMKALENDQTLSEAIAQLLLKAMETEATKEDE